MRRDGERLQSIKAKAEQLVGLSDVEGTGEANLLMISNDMNWLIQQAERVQELEKRLDAEVESGYQMEGQLQDAKAENDRLRKALEFYALPATYAPIKAYIGLDSEAIDIYPIDGDEGWEARRALKGESE